MKQLSSKRENFCRYVSNGLTPTEAYRKAFNVTSDRKSTATEAASRLMKDSKVTATIEAMKQDIQERIASEIVWDKQKIIEELSINVSLGRETKQLAASNQAIKLIGSAVGNVFEPEIQQVNGTIEILHQLPDAVLMQLESMVLETSNIESSNNVPSAIEADYQIVDSEAD